MQQGTIITYEDGTQDKVVGTDELGLVPVVLLEPVTWRRSADKWKSLRVVEEMAKAGKWKVERPRRERVRL